MQGGFRVGDIAPIVSVKYRITHVLKERTMPIIGARLGEHIDDAIGVAAILGAVAVGLYAEFANGIGTRQDVASVA